MRLIDADALRERHCEGCNEDIREMCRVDPICASLLWVDEEPTVDAVELPCRIGDRVWAIRSYKGHRHPQDGIVNEMYFAKDMRLHIVVKHVARGEWGETVFATREEAVAAILERKDNGKI